jgi:hypothetical protein
VVDAGVKGSRAEMLSGENDPRWDTDGVSCGVVFLSLGNETTDDARESDGRTEAAL